MSITKLIRILKISGNEIFNKLLWTLVTVFLLQSCTKENAGNEIITDPFTYAKRINWVEDSIKTGNGEWAKLEKSNTFSWLTNDANTVLRQPGWFATYKTTTNIRTDFVYSIQEDSVLHFTMSSDSLYFKNKNGDIRTDINGIITLSPDTTLVLNNLAASPAISIKYKLRKESK